MTVDSGMREVGARPDSSGPPAGGEGGGTGGVLRYFVRHRTAANLLLAGMLVAGAAALPNMRAQFFPDVIVDDVRVGVVWRGAGPEDVDTAIVQAMEPSLQLVSGVASTSARSREGSASITLEFEPGWDMARAFNDVQVAVDQMTNLPEDAETPTVRQGAWRDRVTDVVIAGPIGIGQLGLLADDLVARLYERGVTRATIRGVVAPRTVIEVPSIKLVEHGVTMAEIAAAARAGATTIPAGEVGGANARVRAGIERRLPEEIAAIPLKTGRDGATLTIGDVAEVRVEGADRARSYFAGPDPAVSVRVDRSDAGDAIGIQREVEDVAAEMRRTLPAGVSIELIRTRAEAISGRLELLVDNGLVGLALVVTLLFLFLNARAAFWVAAGIPVAMLCAIALMYAFGLTLNMISLFGLIITLGIVVDDAIVVGEHADFRARRLGESPATAAENAARRMLVPVVAASLTTVIAFFGLTAIGGRFGTLIRDIPFTVIVVLLASLAECFLVLPNHMSHAIAGSARVRWYDYPNRVVNRGFRFVRDRLFRPFVAGVVVARYAVIACVVLLLASQAALFIRGDVTWRFFNAPERGSVTGNFAMAEGASRADSMDMMRELQRAADAVAQRYGEEHGANPIVYALAEVGGNSGRGLAGAADKDAELLGGIAIELIDADLRPYSSFAFVADLQDEVRRHPALETLSFRSWRAGPGGDSLSVQFHGSDLATLKSASGDLQEAVARYPEVSAVQDDLAYGRDELVLDLTARGQALGFSIDGVGRVLRNRLGGIEAATYPVGSRSAEIMVELPEEELTADFLDRTYMRAPSGGYVPLGDIVSVERRAGFSSILRENGLRVVTVSGDISEDDPERAALIDRELRETILPRIAETRQVEWRMTGLAEEQREFLSGARTGLILCLTGIYLVLCWAFASWTRPLVVMAVIPFGLVGTIWGHHAWGVPLSMFTVVGLLGLTGIIVNDSIVMVTTIDNHARDRGLWPAIVEGATDRLRPVLLTTLTTVLGLAPLLFERSAQAQFLKPTVITLVYGLGFGMVLVLLVVPALLAIQADLARPFAAFGRALRRRGNPMQGVARAFAGLIAVWFAATMAPALATALVPSLSGLLPELPGALRGVLGQGGASAALATFVGGALALAVLAFAVALFRVRRRVPELPGPELGKADNLSFPIGSARSARSAR